MIFPFGNSAINGHYRKKSFLKKETIPMKKTFYSKDTRTSLNRSTIDRRGFLVGMGALSGLTLADRLSASAQTRTPKFKADPFSLGVASGDPLPDGVVLWTRLAPDPINGGGMSSQAVTVNWEIATDEQMKEVVQRGSVVASPAFGHSVHVDVRGLRPGRWYWYRFMAGSAVSPIGRTRTAPALSGRLAQL